MSTLHQDLFDRAGKGGAVGSFFHIMTAALRLQELSVEYWEHRLREYPTLAHSLGDSRYRHVLFRESIGDYERRDAEQTRLLARLEQVPLAELTAPDRITHRLLERELAEAREHYRFKSHLRPILFPTGPEGAIAYAMQKTTLSTPADAEEFLVRLETLPQYFEDQRARLWAGVAAGFRLPRALLGRICASVSAYAGGPIEAHVCYRPLAAAGGRDPAPFEVARARGRELLKEYALPAYRLWLDELKAFAGHCRDTVSIQEEPDGEAYYAFLTRQFTTTRLSAAEIHAIGHDEVARIRAAMEGIAAETGFSGDLAGLRRFLATEPRFIARSKEELRERMEVLAKRIERRIPEFFGRIPRMTYGVESIPEALSAQLPPAYAQPNPPNGMSAGVYWITGLPERCPTTMHVPITLHEAWPGHLMHVALLQEMIELPAFRRNGLENYTAYIEGWAMYCEKLGYDFGLYEDPYARYGQLDMEIWRAVRLVVDTGIHALGWSRAQSIAYMTENVTLPPAAIEAEIDRYIGWPGQALGYKIGELKIGELRERAARRLGPAFDIRALHDRFNDAGPITLEMLDEHVEAWIAAVEEEAA